MSQFRGLGVAFLASEVTVCACVYGLLVGWLFGYLVGWLGFLSRKYKHLYSMRSIMFQAVLCNVYRRNIWASVAMPKCGIILLSNNKKKIYEVFKAVLDKRNTTKKDYLVHWNPKQVMSFQELWITNVQEKISQCRRLHLDYSLSIIVS